jgi:adenine/guanine phosphoribosyltransferase-like PRPP-binding protein
MLFYLHKAQGCPLGKPIVLLDDVFAYGQTYTAISRVRRSADCLVEGLLAMDYQLANQAVADYVESNC